MGYMGWSLKHQSYEKLGEVWILRLPMGSVFFPQNIPYQDPNKSSEMGTVLKNLGR